MQYEFRGKSIYDAVSQAVGVPPRSHNFFRQLKSWSNFDFVQHFYQGHGTTVTLSEIGYLDEVRGEANVQAIDRTGGFKDQIRVLVRDTVEGEINEVFQNTYSFSNVKFAMGGGVLEGAFSGRCGQTPEGIRFAGQIFVSYSDTFEDPASLLEMLYGSSSSDGVTDVLSRIANLGGTPYSVVGEWNEDFGGVVDPL